MSLRLYVYVPEKKNASLFINGLVNMGFGYDIHDLAQYKNKLCILNDTINSIEETIKCNTMKLFTAKNDFYRDFYQGEMKKDREILSHLIELKTLYFSDGCERFYCSDPDEYTIYVHSQDIFNREAKENEIWNQMKLLENEMLKAVEDTNTEINVGDIVKYCHRYGSNYAKVISRSPKKINIQQIKFDVDRVVYEVDSSTMIYYKKTYKMVNDLSNVKESSCIKWNGEPVSEWHDG